MEHKFNYLYNESTIFIQTAINFDHNYLKLQTQSIYELYSTR